MKKLLTALPLILALSSCQNSFFSKDSSSSKLVENDPAKIIVANYEGGKVTLKNVNDEISKLAAQNTNIKGLDFNKLSSDHKETLIKEVVLKEASYKEAKKRDLDDDSDYREALKIFETELLKQKLFITLAKDAAEEKNLKKNYDELVINLQGKKDIRISYISVKTEKGAKYLRRILTKYPGYFAKKARAKSLDKATAKKGGDLGFVVEDALPAEIVKQVKNMPKGQISTPILRGDKWIIAKMTDERPAKILSFEDSKDSLAQNLAKKAIEDFVSKSLEEAKISILVK